MTGFTKLFSTIVTSTIWQEDAETCKIWITLLALSDANGFVPVTIPGLANVAKVSIEKCEEAIAKFEGPDPYSRTSEQEGKRLTKVNGGLQLVNYVKYRKQRNEEHRREYMRNYMQDYRKKDENTPKVNNSVSKVNFCKQQLAHAEADAEADNINIKRKEDFSSPINTEVSNGFSAQDLALMPESVRDSVLRAREEDEKDG